MNLSNLLISISYKKVISRIKIREFKENVLVDKVQKSDKYGRV